VDEETGEVVGHDALVREGLKPVGEYTHLVVAPAYRGQRIRQRMGDFLEQELHQLDVIGLFGQAVTAHTISQRASESRGFHVCGISLAMDSPYVFKKIRFAPQIKESSAEADARPPHRESLVFYFKYLVPPPDTMVYAPRRHSEMLAGIYANLQVQADFREAAPVGGQGQLSVRLSGEDKLGEIEVEKVGADTATEVRRAWRDLCDIGGAEVVYLYLPLSDPGTPDACRSAEDHGFFFSGVWPAHAAHGDYLRLQYLAVQLDPAYIQVFSPFGRELLSYVLQEQQRNSAHRGST
jgi:GNAT superfamily N-acetyltransferase